MGKIKKKGLILSFRKKWKTRFQLCQSLQTFIRAEALPDVIWALGLQTRCSACPLPHLGAHRTQTKKQTRGGVLSTSRGQQGGKQSRNHKPVPRARATLQQISTSNRDDNEEGHRKSAALFTLIFCDWDPWQRGREISTRINKIQELASSSFPSALRLLPAPISPSTSS